MLLVESRLVRITKEIDNLRQTEMRARKQLEEREVDHQVVHYESHPNFMRSKSPRRSCNRSPGREVTLKGIISRHMTKTSSRSPGRGKISFLNSLKEIIS